MSKNNIQIKPSKKKGENKVTVILSEDLNIYTIEDIKKVIIDAVKKYDEIEIKTKDVKSIDVTFVQLFYSLSEKAKEKNKKVILDIKLKDENKTLFDNTDLTRIIQTN